MKKLALILAATVILTSASYAAGPITREVTTEGPDIIEKESVPLMPALGSPLLLLNDAAEGKDVEYKEKLEQPEVRVDETVIIDQRTAEPEFRPDNRQYENPKETMERAKREAKAAKQQVKQMTAFPTVK